MNMQQIMAQAQKMQKDIMAKKDQIDAMEFQGKSDWAEVTMKGDKTVKSVKIVNDEAFDKANSDILEDMLVLAINDAIGKIEKETENKLGAYSKMGGLF